MLCCEQEGHPLDNLLLEIKSYKFAQNREFKECMRPAVEVVLDLAGAEICKVNLVFFFVVGLFPPC